MTKSKAQTGTKAKPKAKPKKKAAPVAAASLKAPTPNVNVETSTQDMEKVKTMSKEKVNPAAKSVEEFNAFGKDVWEAFLASSKVAAKGVEALNAECMAYTKVLLEDGAAASKAMVKAKTMQELVDLQTEFARSCFDSYMSQSTKLGEMTAKTAQEAFEPLNARFQAATEKFNVPFAA